MKMPPPLRKGMYAAYSAAFSRMLSESTPGRDTVAGPEPPLERSVAIANSLDLWRTTCGIRSTALRRPIAAATDGKAAHAVRETLDNSGTEARVPPAPRAALGRPCDRG